MGSLTDLRALAIQAAKNGDWSQAIEANQQIVTINSQDTSARNRLGMALLQQGKTQEAKIEFLEVIKLDATNPIAKKQLACIEKNETIKPLQFSRTQFIEEPGVSKICELHRLAGKQVLQELSSGQECILKPKKRFISVETLNGIYIGSLPDDVSFRLLQLMQTGNKYECIIYNLDTNYCQVFIREIHRSPANQDNNSFPLTIVNALGEEQESTLLLLEEDSGDNIIKDLDDNAEEIEEQESSYGREHYTSEDIDRLQ